MSEYNFKKLRVGSKLPSMLIAHLKTFIEIFPHINDVNSICDVLSNLMEIIILNLLETRLGFW